MLFLPHKTVVRKYASISHHTRTARPSALAAEGPFFLNHDNQPRSGKTKYPPQKTGPGDPKSFSPRPIKSIWYESAFKYFHLFVPVTQRVSCAFFLFSRACRPFNATGRFLDVHFFTSIRISFFNVNLPNVSTKIWRFRSLTFLPAS